MTIEEFEAKANKFVEKRNSSVMSNKATNTAVKSKADELREFEEKANRFIEKRNAIATQSNIPTTTKTITPVQSQKETIADKMDQLWVEDTPSTPTKTKTPTSSDNPYKATSVKDFVNSVKNEVPQPVTKTPALPINNTYKPVNVKDFVDSINNKAVVEAGYDPNNFTLEEKALLNSGNYSVNPNYDPKNKYSKKVIYTGNVLTNKDVNPTLGQKLSNTAERTGRTAMDLVGNVATGVTQAGEGLVDAGVANTGNFLSNLTSVGGLLPNKVSEGIRQGSENFVKYGLASDMKKMIDEDSKKGSGIYKPSILGIDVRDIAQEGARMITLSPLGMAGFMASAAGSSTEEALNEGEKLRNAVTYGNIAGAIEGATEKMFDTFGIIGGGKFDKFLPKSVMGRFITGGIGEGIEEGVSGAINPFVKMLTYEGKVENPFGSKENFYSYLQDLGQQMLAGAVTGWAMQGASDISSSNIRSQFRREVSNAVNKLPVESNVKSNIADKILGGANRLTNAQIDNGIKAYKSYINEYMTKNIKSTIQNQNVQGLIKNSLREKLQSVQNNTGKDLIPGIIKAPQNTNMNAGTQNTIKQQITNTINNNTQLTTDEKQGLLQILEENSSNLNPDAINFFNDTINNLQNNHLEQVNNTEDKKATYKKYLNDKTELDKTALETAKNSVPANKNGRRTKEQWLKVANTIGQQIYDLSDAEIERYAYKSWQETHPNQAGNLNRQGKGFVKFTSDEWIDAVTKSAQQAKSQTQANQANLNEKPNNDIVVPENERSKTTYNFEYKNKNISFEVRSYNSNSDKYFGKVTLENGSYSYIEIPRESLPLKAQEELSKYDKVNTLSTQAEQVSKLPVEKDFEIKKKLEKGKQELKSMLTEMEKGNKTAEDIVNSDAIKQIEKIMRSIPETYTIENEERLKLREKVAQKIYDTITAGVSKEKIVDIIIGPPAAGKSTIADRYIKEHNAALLDSDMIKEQLPEFNGGIGANAVQEESSMMAEKIRQNLMNEGYNFVYPIVGKTLSSLESKINELKSMGYTVNLILNELPTEKTLLRALNRYVKTGRYLSPGYIRNVGLKPSENYDKIKLAGKIGGVDSYERYSNDVEYGEPAKRLESFKEKRKTSREKSEVGHEIHSRNDQGNRETPQRESVLDVGKRIENSVADEQSAISLPENNLQYQGKNLGSGKAEGKNITADKASGKINDFLSKYTAIYDKNMKEALDQLIQVKNKPNAEIKIYRASPSDSINSGDWVYLSKAQAEKWTKTHFGTTKPGYKVTEKTVKASDVDWTGKNLDFVYKPTNKNDVSTDNSEIRKFKSSESPRAYMNLNEKISMNNDSKHNKVGLAQIEETINEIVPVRHGKFRQKAYGIYKGRGEIIRIKQKNDIPTALHELTHHLDKQLDLSKTGNFDSELIPIAVVEDSASLDTKRAEGVAEFGRYYMTDPEFAQEIAPKYFEAFEEKLNQNPEMKAKVQQLQNMVSDYLRQSPLNRVLSHIDYGDDTANIFTRAKERALEFKKGFRKNFFDDLDPLKQVINDITDGKKLSIDRDAYAKLRLNRGVTGKVRVALEHGIVDNQGNKIGKSLKEITAPVSDNIDEFIAYISALRAKDLETRNIDSGFNKKDVDEILSLYGDNENFNKAAEELYSFENAILQKTLVASGIITPEQLKAYNKANPHYVPFYRVMDEKFKQSKDSLSKAPKRIKGSTRDIINPLESIIKNTYSYYMIAEKNDAYKSLFNLANEYDGTGKWFDKVPTDMTGAKISANDIKGILDQLDLDKTDIDYNELFTTIFKPANHQKGNIITVMEKGKPVHYEIMDEDLYKILGQSNSGIDTWWSKILGSGSSALRVGATHTLEFVARNPIKDTFDAFTYSKNKFIPVVDTVIGIFNVAGKSDLYYKWLESGGSGSSYTNAQRTTLRNTLNGLLPEINKQSKLDVLGNIVKHPLKTYLDLIGEISNITEEGTRVGEFRRALKNNKNLRQAALESRDITVDFSRGGKQIKEANKYIAFLNANVQGLDKMITAFKERPVATTIKCVSAFMLPSMLIAALQDDDDRDKVPQWEKDSHWIFFVNGVPIRIPKPQGIGRTFANLGESILDYMRKKDPEVYQHFLIETLGSYSPANDISSVFPNTLQPPFEVATNYSFFRKTNIVPRSMENRSPEYQYDENTSTIAKQIGKKFKVSPKQVDYLISGYFGNLGKDITNLLGLPADAYEKFTNGTTKNKTYATTNSILKKIPLVKGFIASDYANPQLDKFYNNKSKALTNYEDAKFKYSGSNITETQKKELEELKKINSLYNKTYNEIKDLQDEINEVTANPNRGNEYKKLKIKELNNEIKKKASSIEELIPGYKRK